jgi:copper resistance protein C
VQRRGIRRGWRASGQVSRAMALCLAAPSLALAHAVPVAMAPAANAVVAESPREITLRFSERMEPRASLLQLLDRQGRPLETGPARVAPDDPWLYRLAIPALEPGPYTVAWRVLSADDGHVTGGAHGFAVSATAPASPAGLDLAAATPPLVAIGRWVAMLGALTLLGAFIAPQVFGPAGSAAPTALLTASVLAMAAGETAAFGRGPLRSAPAAAGSPARRPSCPPRWAGWPRWSWRSPRFSVGSSPSKHAGRDTGAGGGSPASPASCWPSSPVASSATVRP